jgi:DNA-binding MarR family transcriptional regulator
MSVAPASPEDPNAREGPARDFWQLATDLMFRERPPRMPAAVAEFDLSPMGLKMLIELEPGVEVPMRTLAECTGCDASSVTGIVDRMEARELIERRDRPGDRRVKLIALTAAGSRMREQVRERFSRPPEAVKRLPEEDLIVLRDLMRKAVDGG